MILSTLFVIILIDAVLLSQQRENSYQKRKLPYQVSVEVVGEFRCTGAIISVFWVITVAPCLQNVSASDVIVRAAAEVTQRRGSAHKVRQLLIPSSCRAEDCLLAHGALLQMHTRFKFNRMIRPITLWARTPPPGDTGWSTTWPCHQDHVTINTQRRVTILDSASYNHLVTNPEVMCVSSLDHHPRTDDQMCQNTGALVVIRNRLAGFVLTSYNSTVDICIPISAYIPWIKQTAFGIMQIKY